MYRFSIISITCGILAPLAATALLGCEGMKSTAELKKQPPTFSKPKSADNDEATSAQAISLLSQLNYLRMINEAAFKLSSGNLACRKLTVLNPPRPVSKINPIADLPTDPIPELRIAIQTNCDPSVGAGIAVTGQESLILTDAQVIVDSRGLRHLRFRKAVADMPAAFRVFKGQDPRLTTTLQAQVILEVERPSSDVYKFSLTTQRSHSHSQTARKGVKADESSLALGRLQIDPLNPNLFHLFDLELSGAMDIESTDSSLNTKEHLSMALYPNNQSPDIAGCDIPSAQFSGAFSSTLWPQSVNLAVQLLGSVLVNKTTNTRRTISTCGGLQAYGPNLIQAVQTLLQSRGF